MHTLSCTCMYTHSCAHTHIRTHMCTYICMLLPQDQDNSFPSFTHIHRQSNNAACSFCLGGEGWRARSWSGSSGLLCSLPHCMKRMGLVTGDRAEELWFCLRKPPPSPWGVVCCVCFWFISWKGIVYPKTSIWEDNERGECVFVSIVE